MMMLVAFVYARTYLKYVGLGLFIFTVSIIVYVEAWNLFVAYAPPETAVGSSGMVTVTTSILTTTTISNSTTSVYNETVTAVMCPNGVTSCAGTSEHVDVIVNHPLIPGVPFFTIPNYWTRWNPPDLTIYHTLAYGAIAIITVTITAVLILDARRKEQTKAQTRRRWQ